jgi:hypothetical protein
MSRIAVHKKRQLLVFTFYIASKTFHKVAKDIYWYL